MMKWWVPVAAFPLVTGAYLLIDLLPSRWEAAVMAGAAAAASLYIYNRFVLGRSNSDGG